MKSKKEWAFQVSLLLILKSRFLSEIKKRGKVEKRKKIVRNKNGKKEIIKSKKE